MQAGFEASRFLNVPSFVLAVGQTVQVPGIGPVEYDLAFGGASMPLPGGGAGSHP